MTDARLHVVHVSSAHPWTDNRIHYRECASLADVGFRVSLIANESPVEGADTPVEVVRLRPLSRIGRVSWGTLRAVAAGLRTRPDIVHLHDPELVWSIPIFRILGKVVIFDAHEDLPVQVKTKSYSGRFGSFILGIGAALAVKAMRLSHHVIAATETIATRFPADRVTVVHNYPPLRRAEDSATPVIERSLHAVYIGGIGPSRGSRVMVAAAADSAFPADWNLVLVGPMSATHREELRKEKGWERALYRGQVAPDRARDILLEARVGLVVLQATPAYLDSLPTKLFEYLAAGIPVIASDFPLWRDIVQANEVGVVVDERSPSAIASAVAAYSRDPEMLMRHSANARELAETRLNWAAEVPMLTAAYEQAISRRRRR